MADPYVGEIKIFPYTFAPVGFLVCQGESVSLMQYQALFALIGIRYGGDGKQTFNLPNLSGKAALSQGLSGPGGKNWVIAQTGGTEQVTLSSGQYPSHNHVLSFPTGTGATVNSYVPTATAAMVGTKPGEFFAAPPASVNTTMNAAALTPYAGGGATVQGHENRQPYLVLMPCIATEGIFPTFP